MHRQRSEKRKNSFISLSKILDLNRDIDAVALINLINNLLIRQEKCKQYFENGTSNTDQCIHFKYIYKNKDKHIENSIYNAKKILKW